MHVYRVYCNPSLRVLVYYGLQIRQTLRKTRLFDKERGLVGESPWTKRGISFHVVINVTPTPKLISKYVLRRELSFCAIYLPDFIRDPILPSTAVPQTSCSISQANCKAFVQILN